MDNLKNNVEVNNELNLITVMNAAQQVVNDSKSQKKFVENEIDNIVKDRKNQERISMMLYSKEEILENTQKLVNAILKKNAA